MAGRESLEPDELRYLTEVKDRLETWGTGDGLDETEVEERCLLVENALREVKGYLLRVVRDPIGSRIFEQLIACAGATALIDTSEAIFSGGDDRAIDIMKHPTGSYVLEGFVKKCFQGERHDLARAPA